MPVGLIELLLVGGIIVVLFLLGLVFRLLRAKRFREHDPG